MPADWAANHAALGGILPRPYSSLRISKGKQVQMANAPCAAHPGVGSMARASRPFPPRSLGDTHERHFALWPGMAGDQKAIVQAVGNARRHPGHHWQKRQPRAAADGCQCGMSRFVVIPCQLGYNDRNCVRQSRCKPCRPFDLKSTWTSAVLRAAFQSQDDHAGGGRQCRGSCFEIVQGVLVVGPPCFNGVSQRQRFSPPR